MSCWETAARQRQRVLSYQVLRVAKRKNKSKMKELISLGFSYGGGKASSKLEKRQLPTFHFSRERHTIQSQVDQHRPGGLTIEEASKKGSSTEIRGGSRVKARSGVRSAGNWVRIRKMCPSFPLPTISPSYKETWGRSQKRIRMRNLRPQVYQQLDPRGAWVLLCISQSLSTLAAHQVQGRGKSPWGIWQVKILQLPMI